jgi:hypothetical protein
VTLEETAEQKVVRNAECMTALFLGGRSTAPGFMNWLIKTSAVSDVWNGCIDKIHL